MWWCLCGKKSVQLAFGCTSGSRHYLMKLKIRVFCENHNAEKLKLSKFYIYNNGRSAPTFIFPYVNRTMGFSAAPHLGQS